MRSRLASLRESVVDGITDIRGHKSRTLLQCLGIVLGVASVVATFGLIDGGRRQMNAFYDQTGGLRKIYIGGKESERAVQGASERRSPGLTYDDALALKRDASTLELVEPTAERYEQVRAPGVEKRLEISGVTSAYEPMYEFHPEKGRFIAARDLEESAKVVVLGSTRAEQLFGGDSPIGKTISIGGSAYTVVGVMQRKEFYWNSANKNNLEWMNELVFVPLTTMVGRMSGDRAHQKVAYINVQAKDVSLMQKASDEVTTVLKRAHGGIVDFEVVNRAERMKQMEQNGRIYDVTFLVCGTISLLVGGIVIMNILLASFNERVREVGTRKALGATGVDIMAQFLVESVVVTLLGGFLGLAVGVGFTTAIASLVQQPVVITPQIMLLGLLFSVFVGIFFGFYPAIKAARLNPIEALRYE
jgi:putative ABC transport system permease protein